MFKIGGNLPVNRLGVWLDADYLARDLGLAKGPR